MMRFYRWVIGAVLAGAVLVGSASMAQETKPSGSPSDQGSVYRTVGLGAAAAFTIAVSVLGAAHAVGRVGSAALGAAAEKPELLARSIIFVALAEGLAVLGFAIAMLLVQKI